MYLQIQFKAHLAFLATQGMFSIALNNLCFSFGSLIYVSRSKLYISDNRQQNTFKSGSRFQVLERKPETSLTKHYQNEYSPLQFGIHKTLEPKKKKKKKTLILDVDYKEVKVNADAPL